MIVKIWQRPNLKLKLEGMPDYIGYLGKFFAKQMSEVNSRSMKVKYGLARWSTDLETIPFQKLTSEMIRLDQGSISRS